MLGVKHLYGSKFSKNILQYSAFLPVAEHCPSVKENCKGRQHPEGVKKVGESASLEVYLPENYYDVFKGA